MNSSAEQGTIAKYGRPVFQFTANTPPRNSPVYDVSAKMMEHEGVRFTYFVATKRLGTLSIDELPSELFNNELQQCDTTDTDSMLAFSSQFGFLPSPLLDGADSLIRFRRRTRLNPYTSANLDDEAREGRSPSLMAYLNAPDSLYESLDDCLKGKMPRLLTEAARAKEAKDFKVHEVISAPEVAQAIRSLQCATIISSVYDYMSRGDVDGTAVDMIDYLSNPSRFCQAGAEYFLHRDDLIVRGHKLVSFDERLADDPSFARMATTSQCDARAGYNIALAEALRDNAQSALDYLTYADMAYREAGKKPVRRTPVADDGLDPFSIVINAASSFRPPSDNEGTLGEIITEQFARCFHSSTPWRRCEYCGRIFKKYRAEGFEKNIRETKFCKKSCNVMYIQRQKRNRS